MSIQLLTAELKRFIASSQPEVLCVTGEWGIGKTYTWNHYLHESQRERQVGMEKYAYVSLFGRDSLEDVRAAIVENTVESHSVGKHPDFKTFETRINQTVSLGGRASKRASLLVSNNGYLRIFERALFLAVRNQLICIDDVERAGSGLDIMAVLGLIDSLCREKGCKVVVLLNQDELQDARRKKVFEVQLEKTADIVMTFNPTPAEAAAISIDTSTRFHSWLSEYAAKLQIVNIRVIKKAEGFCRRIDEILKEHNDLMLRQATQTLTLATFAKFQPRGFDTGSISPLKLIRAHNQVLDDVAEIGHEHGKREQQYPLLKSILRNYEFSHADEFDHVLIDGVEAGFFDEDAVRKCAYKNQDKVRLSRQSSALAKAWESFHSSFSIGEDEFLDTIEKAAFDNYEALTPIDLNGVVIALKEFGHADRARRLIGFYVENREADPGFWNLSPFPFHGMISDEDVRDAFEQKYKESVPAPRSPVERLIEIGAKASWGQDDIRALSQLSSADYQELLKRLSGKQLRYIMNAFDQFRRISNPDEQLKAVVAGFTHALMGIGKDSAINAKRVRAYGVRLD